MAMRVMADPRTMLIQSNESADAVRARLHAWSKEWRESKLLPELRALGHRAWPLIQDGESRYRYEAGAPWPLHAFEGVVTITLEVNSDGTDLRCSLDVRPSVRTVLNFGFVFAVLVAAYDAVTSGPSVASLALAAGSFSLMVVTLSLLRPIAIGRLTPTLAAVVALVRAALASAPETGTP